jgi:hypothetical protein
MSALKSSGTQHNQPQYAPQEMGDFDTTGQYNKAVLIGNWNEDKYGVQLSANLGIRAGPGTYDSTQRASYRSDADAARQAYFDSKSTGNPSSGVPAELLFGHHGARFDEADRYDTTYKSATTYDTWESDQSTRNALMQRKKQEWAKDSGNSRNTAYATTSSDAYHKGNSIHAQPVDSTYARKTHLKTSEEIRKMRLRTE